MKVSIISVSVGTKTGPSGKAYQTAETVYKNLDSGKVESKNITQYSSVFNTVSDAQAGQVFNVKTEKNANGFWEWVDCVRAVGETAPVSPNAPSAAPAAKSAGSWETPEERAAKQVYIVRQSSLSTAVDALSIGAKTPPSAAVVCEYAQQLVEFVMNGPKGNLFNTDNDLEVA